MMEHYIIEHDDERNRDDSFRVRFEMDIGSPDIKINGDLNFFIYGKDKQTVYSNIENILDKLITKLKFVKEEHNIIQENINGRKCNI